MGNFNEEIFFKNLGLADGRERFNGMVNRLSGMYSRNQLQELSWLENRGRSHVDSPVGAMGFPQIMPDTLKGLQRNNPNRGYTDPRDPAQAILMMEDLLRENYQYYANKGLPHEVASRKGVRSYHGGYNEKKWGSANRHYDSVVNNGGITAGSGAIAQEQLQRPPGNIDAIRAYNQGMPKKQAMLPSKVDFNFMQPFGVMPPMNPGFEAALKEYTRG